MTHMSSFEKLMDNLSDAPVSFTEASSNSGYVITNWCKKSLKLKEVIKQLVVHQENFSDLLSLINHISVVDFNESQTVVNDKAFVSPLALLLNNLPRDPSLKNRNKLARSVRVITSGILINFFPNDILQYEGYSDDTPEVIRCKDNSQVFVFALRRLLKAIKSNTPMNRFRYVIY